MRYIHLFTFYIHASQQEMKYNISNIVTLSETTYRDILLGQVLKNMGSVYKNKISISFQAIQDSMEDPRIKVGRFVTRYEEITLEEIENVLRTLGCDIASIYLTEKEFEVIKSFV